MPGSAARRGAVVAMSFCAIVPAAAHRAGDLPPALHAFVNRHADCLHFAGEDPYDAARAHALARAQTRFRCDRLDADEKALRHRYAHRPDLLKRLDLTDGED